MNYELNHNGTWKPVIRKTGTIGGRPEDRYETTDGRHYFPAAALPHMIASGYVRCRAIEEGYYMESRGGK